MIFTFYSFKGGVGRSMALANVADSLARRGLRVLAIDFDLEAPGLERYYPVERESALGRPGLVDLLAAFKQSLSGAPGGEEARDFKQLDQFIFPVYGERPGCGRLDIMTAGQRSSAERLRQYAQAVRTFDWQDFYFNWEGEAFFEWLRRSLVAPAGLYDIVLVDSRTGVTEMGGICATYLADVVVMLCAANRQNVEGTLAVGGDFISPLVRSLRHERPLDVLVIPARIEQGGGARLEQFWADFDGAFQGREPEALRRLGVGFRDLAIPYQCELAFNETIVTDPEQRAQQAHIGQAFERLVEALMLFAPGERLKAHRDHAEAFFEALRQRRGQAAEAGGAPPAPEAAPHFDPVKRFAGYDGFLSWQAGDGEAARALRDALAARGFDIHLDKSGLTPGNAIAEATALAMHHSRHLLVCAGRLGLADWQKREIEMARASASPVRILPLLLPGAEADIFALALRGGADLKTVDLREWPASAAEFDWLCQTLAERGGRAAALGQAMGASQAGGASQEPVNPYPGLAAYGEALAGTLQPTADIAGEILDRLRQDGFAVLQGPSGSGKTSLANAAIVPKVRQGALGGNHTEIAWMDPGKAEDLDRLEAWIAEGKPPALVIAEQADHAEALLLDPAKTPAAAEAVERFAALLGRATAKTRVLLLLGDLALAGWRARFPGLAARLDSARVPLPPPSPGALRHALETAAARSGYAFEPGLLDRIVQDAGGGGPAALPLAQLLLPTLWQRAQQGFLTNSAFAELGGIGGVFAEHARKAFEETPPALAEAVNALLLRLVSIREDGEFVWQSTVWERIADQPTLARQGAGALLWLLRRRIVAGQRITPDEFRIDIAKPVPFDRLPGLMRLLEAQCDRLRLRQRLALALAEWRLHREDPGRLPEGGGLRNALRLRQEWEGHLTGEEQRYIAAGLQRRSRRRLRFSAAVLVLLAGLGLGSYVSYDQYNRQVATLAATEDTLKSTDSFNKLLVRLAKKNLLAQLSKQGIDAEVAELLKGAGGLRIYPQYRDSDDADKVALLAVALKISGDIEMQPAQLVTQPTCGEIRFFFRQDAEAAGQLRKAVSIILRKGMKLDLDLQLLDLSKAGYKNAQPGTVELWLPPLGTLAQGQPPGKSSKPDGAELRLVPGGCAILGSRPEDRPKTGFNIRNERNETHAWVDGFYIDRHEITNEQFARFKAACPASEPACPGAWRARGAANEPANHLSWAAADAYCRWAGGRLPTENEWEKAARGTDGRVWPWGDEPDPGRYHGRDSSGGKQLAAVGKYPDQNTQPYGLADMAGNVWELTATAAGNGLHVMKGGSYLNTLDESRAAVSWSSILEPDGTAEYLGFRCAQDVPADSGSAGGGF